MGMMVTAHRMQAIERSPGFFTLRLPLPSHSHFNRPTPPVPFPRIRYRLESMPSEL